MMLNRLIQGIDQKILAAPAKADDCRIGSIHYDSRQVAPGGLFVAIRGMVSDGHDFIGDALEKGAAAIVVQKPVKVDIPCYRVADTRKALAALADRFYDHPSRKLVVAGITGTNGKTTTTFIVERMLQSSGFNVGVIGTVNYRYNQKVFDNPVTTPESLDLQRILAEMLAERVSHVIMEVSSHAIDLDRIFKCAIDVGAFTNLTQDHLDYHLEMQSYWKCKKRLFTEHLNPDDGVAVVNVDDERGRELVRELSCPCITVGNGPAAMVRPLSTDLGIQGIEGVIRTPAGEFGYRSKLTGHFNLANILCAVGIGVALNVAPEALKAGIENLPAVPGRLQRVPGPVDRHVYVDYAHTPDALENVLQALKALGHGRLICVFGCGGNRDRAKRSMMGEISGRLSDLTIVTSDNPRLEEPAAIIDDILPGLKTVCRREYNPGQIRNGWQTGGYLVEPDRRSAIRLGIEASAPGDIVLIAGKGHETYQIVGKRTLPFDDMQEAQEALGN
ncbi:MAG: UDP-N-acetylmuramoyl-L-alanyl-D-glutamate--2,6-diaminopimelate ligase [Deltaproteobacteria bacterium]|nr:UDP-N-acetylmuramoyl-L-alanyl-D-glutamate--2,6-diaminopimelate ligase [Deltaproteobacteria bacterium]